MQPGDHIADFALPDQTGTVRRLSEFLATGPVVLFFYPAAMTYGCTKESCHFRDLKAEFDAVGRDSESGSAPMPSTSSSSSRRSTTSTTRCCRMSIAASPKPSASSGAASLLKVKRSTFVIDTDSTLIAELHSEISMHSHADKALEILRARQPQA